MPKKRPPREVWDAIRRIVWERDGGLCTRCEDGVLINECHIDHIVSGKRGTNKISNLRTLCRRCHVLRIDFKHRGMIAKAIEDGIIPADYRPLLWE
jgi:5-methylcytosine-specific restriction enzyme A